MIGGGKIDWDRPLLRGKNSLAADGLCDARVETLATHRKLGLTTFHQIYPSRSAKYSQIGAR